MMGYDKRVKTHIWGIPHQIDQAVALTIFILSSKLEIATKELTYTNFRYRFF